MSAGQERPPWEGPGSPGLGPDGSHHESAPPPASPGGIPATPQEQHRQLAAARRDFKLIKRAISVARFGGWTTGFFAVASALFLVFGVNPRALFVTAGLAVVSYNEFRGATGLSRLDAKAPALLAWNQVGFAAMLVIYCAWSLYTRLTSPSELTEQIGSLAGAGDFEWIADLERSIYISLYVSVAFLSIIFQGGTALFYHRRKPMLAAYVSKTPQWIRTMMHSE
ncbi:MAG: hypothetical protein D8M59_07070 [Planctomycetes bacterium]|nr:hypothetical protein [Planctomycetota bacterium]